MQTRMLDNIAAFGRLLRAAGMPVGAAQLIEGARAVALAGVREREDFYWALAASLVTRPEHKPLFDQAFELFWRAQLKTRPAAELTIWRAEEDATAGQGEEQAIPLRLFAPAQPSGQAEEDNPKADQRDSASDSETFTDKHFEHMTAEELAEAKRRLAALELEPAPYLTRRRQRDANGSSLDWRRSLRSLAHHAGAPQLAYCSRREESPALVLLCDVSGSMQLYARLLLHFVWALGRQRKRTYAFLFGTRLTPITRYLQTSEVDRAVERICAAVQDFDGGTRIAAALTEFNKRWSRRLLSRKAIVILVSDGLEGEDASDLAAAAACLHRSCGHLMWLNPLLRFAGFEPKASGVRTLLRHVDSVHAVHSLRHAGDVAHALSSSVSWRRAA